MFDGEATLPKFPCAVGDPTCLGAFEGSVSGQLGGSGFEAWEASLADVSLTATFSYEDTTCEDGTAAGTATIDGGLGSVRGHYDFDPTDESTFSAPIIGIFAQIEFTWQREGATASITLVDGTIDVDVVGTGWIRVVNDVRGRASAEFAADLTQAHLETCAGLGTTRPPLTAEVLGRAAPIEDPANAP